MKNILILITILILQGCVSIDVQEGDLSQRLSSDVQMVLTNIDQIKVGMDHDEIVGIMGAEVKVGYSKIDFEKGSFKSIKIKNPHRVEVLSNQEEQFEVLYYFTGVKKADGFVADDELTPLVLANKKLVGKGWDFLFKLKDEKKL